MTTISTKCKQCEAYFNIEENRVYQIRTKSLKWFYDAIIQFENFASVKCPKCGYEFNAQEARLFGVFKSPITVFGICIVLAILLAVYIFFFERR